MKFMPDQRKVEEVLQLFQGAVLAFLITGDPEPGRRALSRFFSGARRMQRHPKSGKKPRGGSLRD
jgi:hypothetical protein